MCYHKIGEPFDVKPSIFQLIIDDHIDKADPKDFGLKNVKSIDPNDYFITSGDAVQKVQFLEKNLLKLAEDLRKESYNLLSKKYGVDITEAQELYKNGKRPDKFGEYEQAVWKSADQAKKLLNKLLEARGDDCFLETEWDSHNLFVIPKNPRM